MTAKTQIKNKQIEEKSAKVVCFNGHKIRDKTQIQAKN